MLRILLGFSRNDTEAPAVVVYIGHCGDALAAAEAASKFPRLAVVLDSRLRDVRGWSPEGQAAFDALPLAARDPSAAFAALAEALRKADADKAEALQKLAADHAAALAKVKADKTAALAGQSETIRALRSQVKALEASAKKAPEPATKAAPTAEDVAKPPTDPTTK